LKLRFLGTGTSFGIPVVGCDCATCTSSDPRDRRTRHGALLSSDDGVRRLLIDTPPELRLQLLAAQVGRVDAVWFTHGHADHVHGIDDLRGFSARARQPIVAWADPVTAAYLRHTFAYIFDAAYQPPVGTTKPEIALHEFQPDDVVEVAGFRLAPVPVLHGDMAPWGFRTGSLGYITDAKTVPAQSVELLRGVNVLVVNALWFGNPHPTHLVVEEAIALAREIGAERTYLTHLTHRTRQSEFDARLPDGVFAAWDNLEIDIPEPGAP
jgi:phosphoribosyl 1,2-cyclic phosphate phosphodiesterase